MNLPERIKLANLPTRIEKIKSLSDRFNKNIYIKRDDETGTEVSGNKVRKLEYAVKEALDLGATHLITCGGVQSNHARATVAVAAKLGLESIVVLRGDEDSHMEGNLFFNKLLGADIRFVSESEFENVDEIMEGIEEELEVIGKKGYSLPVGASNCIGSFGYYNSFLEIMEQEKDLGIDFDTLVTTVGSGGTYAGLYFANEVKGGDKKIYGLNVSDTAEYFKLILVSLLKEMCAYTGEELDISKDRLDIIDGYVGRGYGLSTEDEIELIANFAREEGIILDPVYTGKAMYGFIQELAKGTFDDSEDILFIHTGGIFGWTKEARSLIK